MSVLTSTVDSLVQIDLITATVLWNLENIAAEATKTIMKDNSYIERLEQCILDPSTGVKSLSDSLTEIMNETVKEKLKIFENYQQGM